MNNFTFRNCTIEDDDGIYMFIPLDKFGQPCFPGDMVYDECDVDCKNPFEVWAIGAFDGDNDEYGFHTYIVDKNGKFFYSDEVIHVNK